MAAGSTLLCRHGRINQKVAMPVNPVGYMSTMPKGTVLEHCVKTGRPGRFAYKKTYWSSMGNGKVIKTQEYSNCE